jgi:hypothetical protein
LTHQAMAIVVLAIAVAHAQRFERRPVATSVDEQRHAPVGGKEQAT